MDTNNNVTETTEVTKPTGKELAMDVLKHEQNRSKAKDLGNTLSFILSILLLGALVYSYKYSTDMFYKNDKEWRELFSSYDYITQDGDGINSANYGEQGDLNNGATSTEFEE